VMPPYSSWERIRRLAFPDWTVDPTEELRWEECERCCGNGKYVRGFGSNEEFVDPCEKCAGRGRVLK